MIYTYERDMANLVPGTRVWAAGFAVSRSGTRVVLDLRPCQCELCAWHDRHFEPLLRARKRPARIVVPVLADGTLDWKNTRVIGQNVDISDSKDEAVAAYAHMVKSAKETVRKAQSAIARTERKIHAATEYLTKG